MLVQHHPSNHFHCELLFQEYVRKEGFRHYPSRIQSGLVGFLQSLTLILERVSQLSQRQSLPHHCRHRILLHLSLNQEFPVLSQLHQQSSVVRYVLRQLWHSKALV
ncbi:hypothetical protein HanHA300_Chr16g0607801 [Helianthus annuus]|nr:hypothetical protein HanHA300_Chr16g0607801 [Helianthus annuus]KAJ0460238.1 hypothetical protein HanHA89_Chr16g0658401 [Helianthus annuus]KAJ0640675.1 hypothetical protein HanLR1_Chr16g0618351 [Helianthus annuus]KAJ0644600.1 hypothetical protein HanOQP8_Chr16g0614101 [Helianthus annuus]